MNAFEDLRKIATAKRDNAFKQARSEYSDAIRKIAELESQLTGSRKRPKSKLDNGSLPDIIFHSAPVDRPFSIEEACGFIRAADPDRKFTKASVNTTVNRMKNEGVLKHIATAKGKNQVALYALADANCHPQRKLLIDWAREILAANNKPMKAVEVMVEMVEKGFQMQSEPAKCVKRLKAELDRSNEFESVKNRYKLKSDCPKNWTTSSLR